MDGRGTLEILLRAIQWSFSRWEKDRMRGNTVSVDHGAQPLRAKRKIRGPNHRRRRRLAGRLRWLALFAASALLSGNASATGFNDYPTSARADYVFGCMKANGDSRTALDRCSCSIDVVASLLPYDRYVEAETVLSLNQVPGFFGAMFRSPPPAKAAVDALRRAQAEAEVRCF